MLAFALLPLFALSAAAIQVIAPSNTTGWTSTGAQTIQWTSVSTDPSNFTIQLINPSSPNSPTTLAQNVNTADATYTYTPTANLAPGQQWRVNFISTTSQAGILAQSEYFEVKAGDAVSPSASSVSGSASGVAPSTISTISGTGTASVSASQTQTGSASSVSTAPATSSSAAADRTLVGMSGMGVVAVAILGYFA